MEFISEFEGPWANTEKLHTIDTGDWRFQRPIIKNEKCRRCSWCAIFCPVGCIEKIEKNFAINLEFCKGCGICCNICPTAAITMVMEDSL